MAPRSTLGWGQCGGVSVLLWAVSGLGPDSYHPWGWFFDTYQAQHWCRQCKALNGNDVSWCLCPFSRIMHLVFEVFLSVILLSYFSDLPSLMHGESPLQFTGLTWIDLQNVLASGVKAHYQGSTWVHNLTGQGKSGTSTIFTEHKKHNIKLSKYDKIWCSTPHTI